MSNGELKFRVVNTDNHGGDYPDERWASEPLPEAEAKALARQLNTGKDDYSSRWHKVVREDYALQPGFEP